jgi:hypothetical protein
VDPERFRRVRAEHEAALDLGPEERERHLAALAREDPELARDVRSLLRAGAASLGLTRVARTPPDAGALRSPEDLVGLRLGGCRLRAPLAAGGMGVVFLADQEQPQRTVAIKVMSRGLASASARRRFEVEAEILAKLEHPGIARIFAAGVERIDRGSGGAQELPWIAMELIPDARPLTAYAEERGLDLRARLELFRRVCDAVQHAHGRSVIHRDLKPANVLVGGDGVPRVIDFGIARLAGGEARAQLTLEGLVLGTPQSMAPEQLRGEEVDTRCDVYALGTLLYELVAGTPPYDLADKPTPLAVRMLVEDDPPPPSARRPGTPAELDWICARALARERGERYASAAALGDDVGRFLRDEPPLARPVGTWYRARKYARRHKAGVAAAAALCALGAGLLATYVHGANATARAHGKMLRLADARTLARLAGEASELYPAYPHVEGALAAWLAEAEPLRARLAENRRDLAELRGRAAVAPDDPASAPAEAWEFGALQDAWLHGALAALVADFERFYAPGGLADDVAARLANARTVRERTVDGRRAEWERALASIADPAACPRYGGLALAPEIGLVPLDRDPGSGLWEFLVDGTGAAPPRDADGHLIATEDAGVVLVLVPGARMTPLRWINDGRPFESYREEERDPVDVPAAFVGKWEVTQGQWRRITGEAVGAFRGDRLPAESVSWFDAVRALARAGLELLTSDVWENAMRAGNDRSWWFDQPPDDPARPFAIGREAPLPVGSFPPNPNGLHDLLGNVEEWLADPGEDAQRKVRKGAYWNQPDEWRVVTRASFGSSADPSESYPYRGARPMRPVGAFRDEGQ